MNKKIPFLIVALFCLSPYASPPLALVMGLLFTQFIGHPWSQFNARATQILLQVSVVGLGFGMNVNSAVQAGKEGLLFTIATIVGALLFGVLLGKALKIDRKIAYLISAGTAICGGSAIAAISPAIKAKEDQISVAIGIVFVLNSVALIAFPLIGSALALSQAQFGLWCAIAIHDTSSVVAAASSFGAESLEIATTVKLARALWIIPLSLLPSLVFSSGNKKIKIPYFIGAFILAMVANSYVPIVHSFSHYITYAAKATLTLTLFLIGSGLNFKLLKSVGFKPFLHGTALWVLAAVTSLLAIQAWY